MRRSSAWLVATLAILPLSAIYATPAKPAPVTVFIDTGPDDQCLVTADGVPIAINKPPPELLKKRMLARGVRLTFADRKPDFSCISDVIFPLQREGIDVRM